MKMSGYLLCEVLAHHYSWFVRDEHCIIVHTQLGISKRNILIIET